MNQNTKEQEQAKQLRPRKLGGISFDWQDSKIIVLLREKYIGEKYATAIAIYQTLTHFASLEGRNRGYHVSRFRARLKLIAEKSGKSVSTAKRYLKEFKDLEIVDWETRKRGKYNLTNIWILLDYPAHNNKPTPVHNNDLRALAHNNEPVSVLKKRNYITNKEEPLRNYRGKGLQPIGNYLDKYKK